MKTYLIIGSIRRFCQIENKGYNEPIQRKIQASNTHNAIDDFCELIADEENQTRSQIDSAIKVNRVYPIKSH